MPAWLPLTTPLPAPVPPCTSLADVTDPAALRGLTLDLDDTLWPVWPTIARAEAALHDWLADHLPRFARHHPPARLAELRRELAVDQPGLAHDLSLLRLHGLRRALAAAGEDPALAEPAFAVFLDHRQRVELFADALPALQRLSARYPIVAVTNGNADLERIGLAGCFVGCISAGEVGVAKPHPAIFDAAARRLAEHPAQLLHIGDDLDLDVHASLDAGWGAAAWVRRSGGPAPAGRAVAQPAGLAGRPVWVVDDLLALCARLGV